MSNGCSGWVQGGAAPPVFWHHLHVDFTALVPFVNVKIEEQRRYGSNGKAGHHLGRPRPQVGKGRPVLLPTPVLLDG